MRGADRRAVALLLALALAAALPVAAAPPVAGEPANAADGEIRALIAALAGSPCRFQRNDNWYDAARAAAHLQRKYDYLRRRGQAGDAEQFIARAASTSSVSGRPYRVACPGQAERDAGPWFDDQLRMLRHHPSSR